jgi:hypothetical protein
MDSEYEMFTFNLHAYKGITAEEALNNQVDKITYSFEGVNWPFFPQPS